MQVRVDSTVVPAQTDLRGQTNGGFQSTRFCVMQSSAAGFEVGAKGQARLSLSSKGQRFDVVVKASVPDGTILTVAVVRTDGRFADVGVIDMLMRVGTLSLDTFNNKSSAAISLTRAMPSAICSSFLPMIQSSITS